MATALPMKLTVVDEVSAEEEDVVSLPPVTRPAAAEIPGTCTATIVAVEDTIETWASVESDPEDGTLTQEGEFERWYNLLVRKVDSKAESVISDEKVAAGNGDADQREPLFGDVFFSTTQQDRQQMVLLAAVHHGAGMNIMLIKRWQSTQSKVLCRRVQ